MTFVRPEDQGHGSGTPPKFLARNFLYTFIVLRNEGLHRGRFYFTQSLSSEVEMTSRVEVQTSGSLS